MQNNYEQIIQNFDIQIDQYVNDLEDKIEDINFDFEASKIFDLSENFDSKEYFKELNTKGVYLFEINLDSLFLDKKKRVTRLQHLTDKWGTKKTKFFFAPSIIKKKKKEYDGFNEEWLPLYIGKCKNMSKRIIEHIDLLPEKQTYAMKLKHRSYLYGAKFRVSTLELDVKNYDFIVPHIERTLREKYKPIVGKQ